MLDRNKLVSEIRKITDTKYENFVGFPSSISAAANRWSEALRIYGEDVIPFSTASELAKNSMSAVLLTINGNSGGQQIFKSAIQSFAISLASGMSPDFAGIPPIGLPPLDSTFNFGLSGATAEQVAEEIATTIHEWFVTGTAINNSSGITINWS